MNRALWALAIAFAPYAEANREANERAAAAGGEG